MTTLYEKKMRAQQEDMVLGFRWDPLVGMACACHELFPLRIRTRVLELIAADSPKPPFVTELFIIFEQ